MICLACINMVKSRMQCMIDHMQIDSGNEGLTFHNKLALPYNGGAMSYADQILSRLTSGVDKI